MTSMISPLILLLWICGFCRIHPLLPLSPKPGRKWLKSQIFHLRAGKSPTLQIPALLSVRQVSARLPAVRPKNLPNGNPLLPLLCLLHRLQTLPGKSRHLQDLQIPLLQVLPREPRFLIIMKPDPFRLHLLHAETPAVPIRPSWLPDRALPLPPRLGRLPGRALPLPTRLNRLPDRVLPLPPRLSWLPPGAGVFPIAKQTPRLPQSVLLSPNGCLQKSTLPSPNSRLPKSALPSQSICLLIPGRYRHTMDPPEQYSLSSELFSA